MAYVLGSLYTQWNQPSPPDFCTGDVYRESYPSVMWNNSEREENQKTRDLFNIFQIGLELS